MDVKLYLILFGTIISCHSLTLHGRNNSETSTSPTISVQRFRSSTYYNYVKLAPTPTTVASEIEPTATSARKIQSKDDVIVFSEDDAEGFSTQSPTSSNDAVAEDEQITTETSSNANEKDEDGGATSNQDSKPDAPSDSDSSGTENGNTEASAPDNSEKPADPVPGQPGEDALENAEDSSESDSSSSSSSEEFIAKKVLKQKFKNDIVSKHIKSKDSVTGADEPKKSIRKNRQRKFL